MRQFLLGLSFSVVFFVGCAVGTMQGSQVAQAQAQAPEGVTKWEYTCKGRMPTTEATVARMSELGADGWEAFGADPDEWCFKRPPP